MSEINESNMGVKLVEYIPELKDLYDDEIRWWNGEEPGFHNLYGDVLNPFLLDLLGNELKEKQNKQLLERIFDFLEILACLEDSYMQEVVHVTVCERLTGGSKRVQERAMTYMKPRTKEIFLEIRDWRPGS